MRRINIFLPALIILTMMASCAEDEGYSSYHTVSSEIHFLRAEANDMIFAAEDHTNRDIYVEAEGVSWAFAGMADWLHLSTTTGIYDQTVYASVDQNYSGDDMRTSAFKISDTSNKSSYKKNFSATQYAAEPFIIPGASSVSISGAAFSATYTVDSNVKWSVDCSDSWITAKQTADGKSVTVNVEENTSGRIRYGSVYLRRVADGEIYGYISFTQSKATASSDITTLEYGQAGGAYELKLTSEATWTASASDSWIEVSPEKGKAGDTKLTISTVANMTENTRTGYVYVSIGTSNAATIKVSQEGINLSVDYKSLNFKTVGEEKTITITTNIPCEVISKPSWITSSDVSITESKEIKLTASPNYTSSSRSGTVKIGINGTTIERSISVSQSGWNMDNLIGSLSYDDDAIDDTLKVDTFDIQSKWAANSNVDWITVSPESGDVDTEMVVSLTENTTADTRVGYLLLSYDGVMHPVEITQAGKYFTIDPSSATLSSRGGTHRVQITTNDEWTATPGSTWMTLSATSGSGDINVVMTAADNPSINLRRDTTTFSPMYLQPVRVITTQAARYLRVNTTGIAFFRKGGDSETFKITTDADYSVTTDVNWLTVTLDKEKNEFKVTATSNTAEDGRNGKVLLAMTGLVNNENYVIELPVFQKGTRETIVVTPFGQDENWSLNLGGSASLTVVGYGTDENWNPSGTTAFTVNITGYTGDENWNMAGGTGANIGMNGHGNDENWNQASDTDGDISKDDHGDDENWSPDGDGDTDADISVEDHGDEEDWNQE